MAAVVVPDTFQLKRWGPRAFFGQSAVSTVISGWNRSIQRRHGCKYPNPRKSVFSARVVFFRIGMPSCMGAYSKRGYRVGNWLLGALLLRFYKQLGKLCHFTKQTAPGASLPDLHSPNISTTMVFRGQAEFSHWPTMLAQCWPPFFVSVPCI